MFWIKRMNVLDKLNSIIYLFVQTVLASQIHLGLQWWSDNRFFEPHPMWRIKCSGKETGLIRPDIILPGIWWCDDHPHRCAFPIEPKSKILKDFFYKITIVFFNNLKFYKLESKHKICILLKIIVTRLMYVKKKFVYFF